MSFRSYLESLRRTLTGHRPARGKKPGRTRARRLSVEPLEDRMLPAVQFLFIPAAGTPQNVINGFQEAAGLWEHFLDDNVTVVVNIGFVNTLPGNVIGSTNNTEQNFTYTQVRNALIADVDSADDVSAGEPPDRGGGQHAPEPDRQQPERIRQRDRVHR